MLADLKTNETGRLLAANPDHLTPMLHVYEHDAPILAGENEVRARLVDAERLQAVLLEALGTPYSPEPAFVLQVSNSVHWAATQTDRARGINSLVRTLSREAIITARVTHLPPSTVSLEEAMGNASAEKMRREIARPAPSSSASISGNVPTPASSVWPAPQPAFASPSSARDSYQPARYVRTSMPRDGQLVCVGPEGVTIAR